MFSMGMFCLDEVRYQATNRAYSNVIGGAGTFAALGAGVHLPPAKRHAARFVLDKGSDFSADMENLINDWGLGVVWRQDDSRKTTHTLNTFVGNEERLFEYLSPKKQITPDDISAVSPRVESMHLVCAPLRCVSFLKAVESNVYVYEPVPTACFPNEFENLKIACAAGVSVLSPNALEAARFVNLPEPVTRAEIENLCTHFAFAKALVMRCGAMGSYLSINGTGKWYVPYHESPAKVVDPTGAGNAFCGALALALGMNLDWDTAMAMASIGASYMIEQVGPPIYSPATGLWNESSPADRVQEYLSRL